MKEKFKRLIFAIIIVVLILVLGVVIKTGKLKKLEGYMYSFAAEITDSATDSNATSSNVQGCATSSDAKSDNTQVEEKEYSVTTTSGDVKEKDKVAFLESHKMYVIIIGVSILAIIVVVVILIVDKKVKNKTRT